MTEEQYLMERINLLREAYQREIQPLLDRLYYLKSIELPVLIIKKEQEAAALYPEQNGTGHACDECAKVLLESIK